MSAFDLIGLVLGMICIVAFSILAGKAEAELWRKCRRDESRLKEQQQITFGKSHCR